LVLALALAVVMRPTLRPDKPGLVAVLALASAFALGEGDLAVDLHWLHLPLVVAVLGLIPAVTVARCFRSVDMIAVLFHKDFGMQGVSLAGLKNEIATAVISSGLILVASIGLGHHWSQEARILPPVIVALLLANPFVQFGLRRHALWLVSADLTVRLVAPTIVPDAPRPDLVIVYLEGLDRRFADGTRFGSIYQPLARFAEAGISFTNVRQIAGTGWSLAGMVASQSGVPVPPRSLHYQSRTADLKRFMPGTVFLGDVLAEKGYSSRFIVGGDLGFGGIGAMYATHGITGQTGLDELQAIYPPDEFAAAKVDWFIDDQMVLDAAHKAHVKLISRPEPLALIVETIGPHGPKGILSRRKTGTGRAGETRDIALAAACLVDEVVEFLDGICARQAEHGRALRIVLLSDHLNHTLQTSRGAARHDDSNTVIFWGAPGDAGRVVERPGSMVDVFPTMLEWLGWSPAPAAAGIGKSLLSPTQTLVEEFGVATVDRMVLSDAAFANQIWDEAACLAERPGTA
jgi:phosphoglycerol transferase